jgi:hypothetical protein
MDPLGGCNELAAVLERSGRRPRAKRFPVWLRHQGRKLRKPSFHSSCKDAGADSDREDFGRINGQACRLQLGL